MSETVIIQDQQIKVTVKSDTVKVSFLQTNTVTSGGGGGTITNGSGTTANGTAVDLGGTITQDTDINVGNGTGNLLRIFAGPGAFLANSALMLFDDDDLGSPAIQTFSFGSINTNYGKIKHALGAVALGAITDGDGEFQLILSGEDNRAYFTDARTIKRGIEYDADGYVQQDGTLTDKRYVDAAVLAGPFWKLASTSTLTGAVDIVGTTTNIIKHTFNTLGTTQTNGAGLWLTNTTVAAAGAQQVSPSLTLEGQGWKTNSTAASQSVKFTQYVLPVEGAVSPSGIWKLAYSINAGAYTDIFTASSSGKVTFTPNATVSGINIGTYAGAPSTLVNGDAWVDTNAGMGMIRVAGFSYRIMGATSAVTTDARIPFYSSASAGFSASANLTFVTNRLIGTTLYLTLSAGTATAGTCPLVMTTGTLLTAAIAGGVEYNNTFHMTNSDATRRHVVLAASATKTTAGAPYTNDGYITMNIGGTDVRLMTTA